MVVVVHLFSWGDNNEQLLVTERPSGFCILQHVVMLGSQQEQLSCTVYRFISLCSSPF